MQPNAIAFVGLCNEYCQALESAREADRTDFINHMLRLLPRIYISATDIAPDLYLDQDVYINQACDEDYYDAIRLSVEQLLGPDDTYLEVFVQEMKYSDTPIAVSISEGMADLFQEFYNFLDTVRDTDDETVSLTLQSIYEDFHGFWSQTLCNVLRALNNLTENLTEE